MTIIYFANDQNKRINRKLRMQDIVKLAADESVKRDSSIHHIKYDAVLTILDPKFICEHDRLYSEEYDCPSEPCPDCKYYDTNGYYSYCQVADMRHGLARKWYIDGTDAASDLRWHGRQDRLTMLRLTR